MLALLLARPRLAGARTLGLEVVDDGKERLDEILRCAPGSQAKVIEMRYSSVGRLANDGTTLTPIRAAEVLPQDALQIPGERFRHRPDDQPAPRAALEWTGEHDADLALRRAALGHDAD